MQVFNTPSRIIITCHGRQSPYLQQEVTALGFRIVRAFTTGVELYGTVCDCICLNLQLRCASQVMYSLKQFYCDDPDELYREAKGIVWENLIQEDGYFSITSNVFHPTIRNNMYANVRVKDAIVDRMRRHSGSRPDTGSELRGAVFYLFWKNNKAEIFIDTSGETLAKHGYRKLPGQAPMLESLAASVVMATKWNKKSPFLNPMCGAGTLAIEAAMMASNRAPGLLRINYSFMHILGYKGFMYAQERRKIEDQVIENPEVTIVATDISEEAVNVSKINATAAWVEKMIQFEVCDFEKTKVPEGGKGVVLFNPEYGERLGEEEELVPTYARIGDFMKQKCGGYSGYVFTGNPDLARRIGLRPKRKTEFYNAKIDCRLLEYELYEGTRRVFDNEEE